MQRSPATSSTILIVEDHPATRDAVVALLDGLFPDYQLVVAESAEAALSLCAITPPPIVIMDISLPGMNGIEATQLICARYPSTRVVMHSSNDTQLFRIESAAAGASAFVSKGRGSSELVGVVAKLLNATA